MKILLIDAVDTLISSDVDYNIESRSLNKELADFLATRNIFVVVTSNAFGDKGKKVRDLLSPYSFQFFSLDNRPAKTDPAYFVHLLGYYGFDPADCFTLDHKQENLDSAKTVWIEGELFLNTTQAIEFLNNL